MKRKGGYSWIGMISMAHSGLSHEELVIKYNKYLAALKSNGYEYIADCMRQGLELTKDERTIVLNIMKEVSENG